MEMDFRGKEKGLKKGFNTPEHTSKVSGVTNKPSPKTIGVMVGVWCCEPWLRPVPNKPRSMAIGRMCDGPVSL
ncbi:hypothetical protein F2Q69_00052776 [Brassica cretica]|uniref:Uncharacterized protein n=1 Tax=Brassica cretica TaxID=69181 RepID=A0A8S9MSX9_BRACR|nr:hypothetical protein F2Q69_00052776 [Brassica cretica]